MPAFFDVVDLYRLVASRGHDELAFVIVVQGQYMRLWTTVFDIITSEELYTALDSWPTIKAYGRLCRFHTLVGRKLPMTSDRLDTEAVVPMVRWMLSDAPFGVLDLSMSIGVEDIVDREARR
jgi:hypothetical protein